MESRGILSRRDEGESCRALCGEGTAAAVAPFDLPAPTMMDSQETNVGRQFSRHEILLTGGSGFLGKVVLGLLLDRFPEVSHIHFLSRPSRDFSAEDRFEKDILASPALAPVVESHGREALRKKITVWAGDVSKPQFGLSARALERMRGRAGVIINCAGRVDFLPPVDESFSSNVDGAEHAVEVAKWLGAALLHVSTAFVSGKSDGLIEETEPILGYYPRRRGPNDRSFDAQEEIAHCREQIRRIKESSNGGGKSTREQAKRLIALGERRAEHWGWVNTYTYAKSLGEQVIAAETGIRCAIVRPAIVESALRFPFPGWIEGGRTAAPLVLMALGGMKAWPVRRDMPLEIVPVDLVAAAILTVAALLLDGRNAPVYHLATADVNPIHLGTLVRWLESEAQKRQRAEGGRKPAAGWFDRQKRVRFVSVEQARARRAHLARRVHRLQSILEKYHKASVPLPGKKALANWSMALRTLELQAKFREQTLDQYLPFILHNRYIFECENIRAGYERIASGDRERLPWDPQDIAWKDYWIHNQVPGIERWVQPDAVKEWAFRI